MANKQQLIHCMQQLDRFSQMFKTRSVDSKERTLQFGYNLGRLVVLAQKESLHYSWNPQLASYTLKQAHLVINNGLLPSNPDFENQLIDFGFALGFVQETKELDYEKWWKPLVPLCCQDDWKIVALHAQQILSLFDIKGIDYYYFPVFHSNDNAAKIDWHCKYSYCQCKLNSI